jgi:hypothetical protein
MKPFSVNSTSSKASFTDSTEDIIIVRGTKSLMTICAAVKTMIVQDGTVQQVTDAFYELTGKLRKQVGFDKIEIIGYLARCTDETFIKSLGIDKSPSIAVNAKAFGKNVNPGHSFNADCDFDNGEAKNGIYVPESFKPFSMPKKSVSFASMGSVEDQHPADAPHPADSPDPADFDAQV